MAEGEATAAPTKQVQYWPALESIRGVGMILVMAYHFLFTWTGDFFYGLTPFFTLSGFLITTLLLSERERSGRVDFKRFYARRAYRLLPALFTMATLYVIAQFFLAKNTAAFHAALKHIAIGVSYVSNWALVAHVTRLGDVVHLWSLATEEQFYVLWPPVLIFLLGRGVSYRKIAWGTAIAFVVSGVLRWVAYQGPSNTHHAQYGFDTRGGEIILGCALALLIWDMRGPLSARASRWLRVAGSVAFITIAVHMFVPIHDRARQLTALYPYRLGFSVVAICAAVLVANIRLAPGSWWQKFLEIPVFVWIGKISYGLYLFHLPIFRLLERHTDLTGFSLHATQFGLSIAAGAASFYAVEMPFQRLRDRRSKARAALMQTLAEP